MGVPVTPINKIGEGSPHVVDLIRERRCDLVINTPTGSGARTDGYEIRTAAVRHGIPCVTTMTGASAAVARDRRRASEGDAEVRSLQEIHGRRVRAAAARDDARRFGRRLCEVTENRASGGYRVFSLRDQRGPGPERGPVLHARRRAPAGRRAAAGPSCRGRSRSPTPSPTTDGVRLDFLVEASARAPSGSASSRRGRGSGSTARSATPSRAARAGRPGAAGAILVGGGIGIAPLALCGAASPTAASRPASCSASATEAHSRRPRRPLLAAAEVRPRQRGRPRRPPAATSPTCSRRCSRATTPASAAVYACGPPAMLEAVRAMCAERGVACELAMESPMACGFGACFGCAVPLAGRRLHAPLRRRAGGPRRRGSRRSRAVRADRLLRHRARAPGHQRLRAPSTRSPPGGSSATRCSRTSPSPPSSRRRSRPSRGPATSRSGSGRRRPG